MPDCVRQGRGMGVRWEADGLDCERYEMRSAVWARTARFGRAVPGYRKHLWQCIAAQFYRQMRADEVARPSVKDCLSFDRGFIGCRLDQSFARFRYEIRFQVYTGLLCCFVGEDRVRRQADTTRKKCSSMRSSSSL